MDQGVPGDPGAPARMRPVHIRPARAAELDPLKTLSRLTSEEHARWHPYAFAENNFDAYLAARFDMAFIDPGGRPVAELSWWVREDVRNIGNGTIEDIFVLPEMRGLGVGDALIAKACDLADARDWDNLEAQVFASNSYSEALFRRAGFLPQATTYRYGPTRRARPVDIEDPAQPDSRRNLRGAAFAVVIIVVLALVLAP